MTDLLPSQMFGWAVTAMVAAMAIGSAAVKLLNLPGMNAKWNRQLQMPDSMRVWAAVLEITAALCFLLPSTAQVGGVLLTAYLGGAIALHLRVRAFEFAVYASVMIALIWGAISLRI
ncbi:DoxX family protein [Aporhodopirellula aestuarii]|uniref:DoxX family protein n=1 Tax=Aporhodopirellula aestuarii TaxID=2950107 RepID=A0ABT0TWN2_9BACT|nr:DoxX family protein [Aporhodopirellula aestuarii]MCM2369037.1 DoxX family protein [Aporhodopirellula aestuarii]